MVINQFENILLQPEQKELLAIIVEAARNVPRHQRQKFIVIQADQGDFIHHPALGKSTEGYLGDVETLDRVGLLALSYRRGTPLFDVTPLGFEYYNYMKKKEGEPSQRVEKEVITYLAGDYFQRKYGEAYQKWARAEEMLWETDSESQLTAIGHLCREAMQEFAEVLTKQYSKAKVNKDKSKTVATIKMVFEHLGKELGRTKKTFLGALLSYWGTVSDLVQRQEHGGQKERESLVWEDGRCVVFQTAVVMFEIDRAISQIG